MNLSCLLSLLKELPAYRQLVGELSTAKSEHKAIILDAARPYLIAALYEELNLPFMVVTGQPESARKLHEQLRVWCSPSAELHRLPELDFLPYDSSQLSAVSYQMMERLRALATLALYQPVYSPPRLLRPDESGLAMTGETMPRNDEKEGIEVDKPPLIVTSALAIMSKTIPHRDFVAACHILKPGMAASPWSYCADGKAWATKWRTLSRCPGR